MHEYAVIVLGLKLRWFQALQIGLEEGQFICLDKTAISYEDAVVKANRAGYADF